MFRTRIVIFGLGLVIAFALVGCSSDDGTSPETPQPNETTTSGGATDGSTTTGGSQATTTTADGESNSLGADHPRTDVSHATVVVGDEVLYYAQVDEEGNLSDTGTCDPEFLGANFRAILRRVDEQGANVVLEDNGEAVGFQGSTFSFTGQMEESIIALTPLWQVWESEGFGSVDSLSMDGNTVRGTATFVGLGDDGGEATETGEFEVTCVS